MGRKESNQTNKAPVICAFLSILAHYNPCHAEYFYVLHSSSLYFLVTSSISVVSMYFSFRVVNSVDPDQMVYIS